MSAALLSPLIASLSPGPSIPSPRALFLPSLTDGSDSATLDERFSVYRALILNLHSRASSPAAASDRAELPVFVLDQPIVVIASPGRDRLMMGHVSSPHRFTTRLPSGHPSPRLTLSFPWLCVDRLWWAGRVHH